MPDATDPNIAHPDAEAEYQANLIAARERLAKIEAAMGNPAPTAQPAAAPTPAPAPASSFTLTELKNPTTPVAQAFHEAENDPLTPIVEEETTLPQTPAPVPPPAPDVAAIIAAHKSVSPLSDTQKPAELAPAPKTVPALPQNPLTKSDPAPEHLKPVKTPPPARSMPSRLRPIITAVIVFFVVLAAFKAPIFYYQIKYLFESPKATQVASNSSQISSTPTLTIPKINVSTPVVFEPSIAEANVQKALESGVVHYGNTAEPGKPGNAVIFGHSSNDWDKPGNFKFIFVLLEKLGVGDTFTIDYKGTRYEYQIYDRKIVLATDISVVAPTADPTATLITCWPTGTSQKRLVVHAKQVSPQPAASQVASETPKLNTVSTTLPGSDSNNGITGTVTTWIENIRSALKGEQIQVNDQ